MVVLRRRLPATLALTRGDNAQGELFWSETRPGTGVWEFAVLATSLDLEVRSVAQLYRDRADAENGFDELKNQWGWGGFTTRDLTRCRHMARLIALVYNWWSLFERLADPDRHREAITSRPLLLHGGEDRVWGDAGYHGVGKREEKRDAPVDWRVAPKPGRRRRLDGAGAQEAVERGKVSVRAKVEHPFLYLKRRDAGHGTGGIGTGAGPGQESRGIRGFLPGYARDFGCRHWIRHTRGRLR